MGNKNQCRAIKRDGKRCTNQPKFGGFCGTHLPKQRVGGGPLPQIGKGLKTFAEAIAIAGGAIQLIEKVVEVWGSLPFGPPPQMPDDYTYLARQFRPTAPPRSRVHRVFVKSPDSIDWHKARKIYDGFIAVLADIEVGTADADAVAANLAELDRDTNHLFNSMLEPIQETIYERIGEEAGNEMGDEKA